MTQEEKAKRYDEALERAKKYKLKEDLIITQDLFPELAESEDERIRKELIFYFQEEIPQCSIQEHADKMKEFISWLKRREVERTKLELKAGNSYFCYKSRWERADNETFKKGLIYKCNKDGVLDNFVIKNPEQHFIEIKDERIAWLEKQGDKEPMTDSFEEELSEICNQLLSEIDSEWLNNEISDCLGTTKWLELCNNTAKQYKEGLLRLARQMEKQGEQKPDWSEEDEVKINRIVACLENLNVADNDILLKDVEWLKSLKDRVQPQPKQEWSEEDKEIRNELISHFESLTQCIATEERHKENRRWLNWLKSLRPQSQWKPSEEMLEALYRAIPENVMEISEDEMLLDKLYQGLKYGRVLSKD